MTAALKEVMRNRLSNLTDESFEEFKQPLNEDGQVKWGDLYKATRVQTVNLIVQAYSSTKCGDIMVAMLRKIKQNEVAMDLEKDLANLGGQSSNPLQSGGGGGVNVNVSAHSGGMVNAPSMSGCTVNGPLTFSYGGVSSAQQGAVPNYGQGPFSIQKGGQEFFNKHKWDLETRLGVLPPLLIELERNGVLSRLEREQVQCKPTSQEQNHILISMVERKGAMAQEKFYQALLAHEPLLVEDLQQS